MCTYNKGQSNLLISIGKLAPIRKTNLFKIDFDILKVSIISKQTIPHINNRETPYHTDKKSIGFQYIIVL